MLPSCKTQHVHRQGNVLANPKLTLVLDRPAWVFQLMPGQHSLNDAFQHECRKEQWAPLPCLISALLRLFSATRSAKASACTHSKLSSCEVHIIISITYMLPTCDEQSHFKSIQNPFVLYVNPRSRLWNVNHNLHRISLARRNARWRLNTQMDM